MFVDALAEHLGFESRHEDLDESQEDSAEHSEDSIVNSLEDESNTDTVDAYKGDKGSDVRALGKEGQQKAPDRVITIPEFHFEIKVEDVFRIVAGGKKWVNLRDLDGWDHMQEMISVSTVFIGCTCYC